MSRGPAGLVKLDGLPVNSCRQVLLVDSDFLAASLGPLLAGTRVIAADPGRLGDSLYRDGVAAICGEWVPVYTPADLSAGYRDAEGIISLQGLLGVRLQSLPLKLFDLGAAADLSRPMLDIFKVPEMLADEDRRLDSALIRDRLAEATEVRAEAPPLDKLLRDVSSFVPRYVVFVSPAQKVAVSLWIVYTHMFSQFDVSPYLAITSPEKRCGKTRVLDVLELLVAKPWRAITPSEAVAFRKIQTDKPTLLLDEIDAIFGKKTGPQHEGLRAILNAGHQQGTTVPRCVGEGRNIKVRDFKVYCPKALAGIGKLPDTVADRSIPIRLARRTRQEPVEKFRSREVKALAEPLKAQIEASAAGVDLRGTYPEMPDELNDRAADSWEPLLAIADAAGGKWPEAARKAALSLSADVEPDDDSLGIRLLADCRTVFGGTGADRLPSKDLLDRLNDLEESPWADWEKKLTSRKLAAQLKKYGVKSKQRRFDGLTLKGYLRDDFADAWRRYTTKSDTNPKHPKQPADRTGNDAFSNETKEEMFPFENSRKPADRKNVSDVSDKTANTGTGEEKRETDSPEPEQGALTFEEKTGLTV